MDKELTYHFKIDPCEELFGMKFGDPRISVGLKFILKNWDHEKETFEEFHKRMFGDE